MKNLKHLILMLMAGIFMLSSCKDNDDEPDEVPLLPAEVISQNITANITLTADRPWILKGATYVQTGAVLTIEAGTIIKADITEKGALIINKGARIEAIGTAEDPIIFTSGKPVNGRAPGDWAGITIIGEAPTNRTYEDNVEGGVTGVFGLGTKADDNSGTLKYVRIEYAGLAVSTGSEVNALSLYAVGSGTTLDHIQVSYAKDDAFEFFGGTVNGKYLIAYGTSDDDFDFDLGYSGKLQFGVVLRRPELSDAGDAGNGIECDNESTIPATGPSTPRTKPLISNFTFLGSNGATGEAPTQNFGLRFRKATQFALNNSIILGFKEGGFVMESGQTASDYVAGTSSFKNNLVHALKNPFYTNDASAQGIILAEAIAIKATTIDGSVALAAATDAQLAAPFNLTAPDFKPATGSPALSGTWVNPDGSAFFTTVAYRGAFSANDNWTTDWTNFDPGTAVYE